MVSQDLIDILRCPACVREKEGLLEYYKDSWFICQDCSRKYPIKDDIPVMLIDEGDKWIGISKEDLPVPPRMINFPMDSLKDLLAELTSGDDDRAELAVTLLVKYDREALKELKPLLEDSRVEARWWAVRALAELHDDLVVTLLIGALQDNNESVRQCAALALRHHPNVQAIPYLIEALSTQNSLTAHLCADALIALGSSAVTDLIRVSRESSQSARLEAVRALAIIADPEAIPTLYEIYKGDSALLAHWANEGLERIGSGMVYFFP